MEFIGALMALSFWFFGLATAEVVEASLVDDVPELACFDHGGGLNACGCHAGKKPCHCHRPSGCGCACEPASCSR
jgi:hypothetical protein